MSSSSPWARARDGHELVDLPVRRLAHPSQLRSLVAHHHRVGNRSSRLTSRRCLPRPASLTCRPGLPGRAVKIRWCFGPPRQYDFRADGRLTPGQDACSPSQPVPPHAGEAKLTEQRDPEAQLEPPMCRVSFFLYSRSRLSCLPRSRRSSSPCRTHVSMETAGAVPASKISTCVFSRLNGGGGGSRTRSGPFR